MINVHNVMEEHVLKRVNSLYDQVKKENKSWLSCDCENCRMDTVCFVLNRIKPHYTVSGRGVNHFQNIFDDLQFSADIDKLCIEGMRLVSQAKRPYHKSERVKFSPSLCDTPVFNFPTFIGNIYDGTSFEPVSGASVRLSIDGKDVPMMDITWQNPCSTYESTKGSFSFWVKELSTTQENQNRVFHFVLEVSAKGYESINYSFSVPLISEKISRREVDSTYSLKIQDLFLFREEEKLK